MDAKAAKALNVGLCVGHYVQALVSLARLAVAVAIAAQELLSEAGSLSRWDVLSDSQGMMTLDRAEPRGFGHGFNTCRVAGVFGRCYKCRGLLFWILLRTFCP